LNGVTALHHVWASGKFKRGFLIGLYDICILLNFVKPVKIYYKYGSSNNSIVTECFVFSEEAVNISLLVFWFDLTMARSHERLH
jgi:hypothetical protein